MAIAAELTSRFPPKVIGDKIEALLNAKGIGKVVKGKKMPDRPNERTVAEGIKLIALLQQMANNAHKDGLGPVPAGETDEEILKRLAATPSARKAAESFLASFEEKRSATLEIEADESAQANEVGTGKSGSRVSSSGGACSQRELWSEVLPAPLWPTIERSIGVFKLSSGKFTRL